MSTPFHVAWHQATPHGLVSAIHLPDSPDPVPDEVLEQLHPDEAAHARTLRAYRQVSFVGGRLALREAASQLGLQLPPVLSDERGCPDLPRSLVGSISHKRTLAVGMVRRPFGGRLGVDLEDYGPPRLSILERVLTPEELAQTEGWPDDRRWMDALLRFSTKEAVYKALDPYVQRYVGFHECMVFPDLHGGARVQLDLAKGEGPFYAKARYEWLHGRLLTTVLLKPGATR